MWGGEGGHDGGRVLGGGEEYEGGGMREGMRRFCQSATLNFGELGLPVAGFGDRW